MRYEFIIRDVKCRVDLRHSILTDENRYEFVKQSYEATLKSLQAHYIPFYRDNVVLLINKLDDAGEFLEIVQ